MRCPQIQALPAAADAPLAEARVVLEVAPCSGDSLIGAKPASAIRTRVFGPAGEGMIT